MDSVDIEECLRYPGLLEVQKAVFEYFWDLTDGFRKERCGSVLPVKSGSPTCACNLKPDFQVNLKDLLFYKEMLSKVAEFAPTTDTAEMDRLKAVHNQIIKSQQHVKATLGDCIPCCHGVLSSHDEQFLCDLLVKQFQWNNSPGRYKCVKEVTINDHQHIQPKSLFWKRGKERYIHLSNSHKFDFPDAVTMEETTTSISDPGILFEARKPPAGSCTNLVFTPSSTLSILFCKSVFDGRLLPFDVVDPSTSACCAPSLIFGEPIIWSPLPSRDRATIFYEHLVNRQCYQDGSSDSATELTCNGSQDDNSPHTMVLRSNGQPQDPELPRTGSNKKQRRKCRPSPLKIPLITSSRRNRKVLCQPVESPLTCKPTVTSSRRCRSSTRRSLRSDSPLDSPETPKKILRYSRRATDNKIIPLTRHNNDGGHVIQTGDSEDDELYDEEAVRLSIDVDCDVGSSKLSPSALSEIAASCIVVEPSKKLMKLQETISTIGELSAPASPTSSEPPASPFPGSESLDGSQFPQKLGQPKVIPLESSDTNFLQSDSQVGTDAGRRCMSATNCAYSTLSWGQDVTVTVQLQDSRWSTRHSCLACCDSGASTSCPFWPSCATRLASVTTAQPTPNQPVYVQVKPEYLSDWGCESLSPEEVAQAWLGSTIRQDADVLRIRISADKGELVWAEHQSLDELMVSYPDFSPGDLAGRIGKLFSELLRLSPGSYLLATNSRSTNAFKIFAKASISESELQDSVDWSGGLPDVFSLKSAQENLHNASTSIISYLAKSTGEVSPLHPQLPLLLVHRLPLDLNLPAGRDETIGQSLTLGRGLRLPALPDKRIEVYQLTHPSATHKSHLVEVNKAKVGKALLLQQSTHHASSRPPITKANTEEDKRKPQKFTKNQLSPDHGVKKLKRGKGKSQPSKRRRR